MISPLHQARLHAECAIVHAAKCVSALSHVWPGRLLMVALFLGTLWLLVSCSKREIPTSAPQPTLHAWVPVTGKSMLPTFPERALVETEFGVPFSALKKGDTVIFWDYLPQNPADARSSTDKPRAASTPQRGRLTHHRLVARQLGNWISQGDNPVTNPVADRPWVTPDNYIARTTGRHALIIVAP